MEKYDPEQHNTHNSKGVPVWAFKWGKIFAYFPVRVEKGKWRWLCAVYKRSFCSNLSTVEKGPASLWVHEEQTEYTTNDGLVMSTLRGEPA